MTPVSWRDSLKILNMIIYSPRDRAGQHTLLFGDFGLGMVMAFFGGIDLLVDPYSNAGTAQIALHVNKFYDVDVRQAGALAYTSDFT